MKAKSLFGTLNMPLQLDGLRILDHGGHEVFFWTSGHRRVIGVTNDSYARNADIAFSPSPRFGLHHVLEFTIEEALA